MRLNIGMLAILGVALVTAAVIGVMSGIILRAHQGALIAQLTRSADQMSETIASSTYHDMLENRRDAVHREIITIGRPGGHREGPAVQQGGERSCSRPTRARSDTPSTRTPRPATRCHAAGRPLERLPIQSRARIYRAADGHRVLGMIRPIPQRERLLERRLPRPHAATGGAGSARREPVAGRGGPPGRQRPAPAHPARRAGDRRQQPAAVVAERPLILRPVRGADRRHAPGRAGRSLDHDPHHRPQRTRATSRGPSTT